MDRIQFILNDEPVSIEVEPGTRLIDLLRDTFDLTGTKKACEQGECGACTVLLNNEAVNSCLIFAEQLEGTSVTTIEGLEKNGELDPIQQAFIECGAIQCGYCTPGMIMSAKALLIHNPHPTDEEIKSALEGNICRCTGYVKIMDAVRMASGREG